MLELEELRAAQDAFYHLPDMTLTFGYLGREFRFYLPDGDHDVLQAAMVRYRTFYEESLVRLIRERVAIKGGTVVDAGANIGSHSVFFSNICGAARVLAFEPNPFAANILERNVELNNARDRIEVRREALSDARGTVSFDFQDPHNLGGTSFKAGGSDGIPATTIDALALDRLDFLKCDVEGAALQVLQGGRQTLGRFQPPIMIELYADEYTEPTRLLRQFGYGEGAVIAPNNYLFVKAG